MEVEGAVVKLLAGTWRELEDSARISAPGSLVIAVRSIVRENAEREEAENICTPMQCCWSCGLWEGQPPFPQKQQQLRDLGARRIFVSGPSSGNDFR